FGDVGAEVETIVGFAPRFVVAGAHSSPLAIIRQLKHMAELSAELLQNSVQALHDSERDLARKVVEQKDEVRSQFESAARVLLTFSFEGEGQRRATVDTLFALNSLERIANYSLHVGSEIVEVLSPIRR